MPEPCGCRVVCPDDGRTHPFIRYCPTHAAASVLLAALEAARQHLVMNEWVDDEGARRRFAAAKEAEAAIAQAKETP